MWVAAALGALTLIPTHTWIQAGPSFAGQRVTWTTSAVGVYTSGPVRRTWRAPKVEPPLFRRLGSLVASSKRVAFIRSVDARPSCGIPCPDRPEVLRRDLLVGLPGGPFKRLNRGLSLDVDVEGDRVLYSDTSSVVLGRKTLVSADDVEYADVALAGRYAAWTEVPRGHNFIYVRRRLVVYDLRAGRVAYRLDAAPFVDIDLAPDGTVAFGQDPTPVGGPNGGVGWASVAEPWPHFLPGDAIPYEVRLAAGRIASFTRGEVVVRRLDGHLVARVPAAYGGFDFDGHRITYLESPKMIAVARLR